MSTEIEDLTSDPDAEQTVERHMVRGAIYGLLLGFGIATYLVLFAIVPFGDWIPLTIVVLLGILAGVLWARFAPPKGAGERPDTGELASDPVESAPAPPAPPEATAPAPPAPPAVPEAPAAPGDQV